MSHPSAARPRIAPLATALLALVAVGLTGFSALDRSWFVSSSGDGDFSVGLISAEMCVEGRCRQTSLSAFRIEAEAPKLGVAVVLAAVLAGLLLFAATARMLTGRKRFSWLPRLSLGAALFAGVLAGAWLLLSPWSDTMAPGLAAVIFFIGVGLAAATSAIPLGALRRG